MVRDPRACSRLSPRWRAVDRRSASTSATRLLPMARHASSPSLTSRVATRISEQRLRDGRREALVSGDSATRPAVVQKLRGPARVPDAGRAWGRPQRHRRLGDEYSLTVIYRDRLSTATWTVRSLWTNF